MPYPSGYVKDNSGKEYACYIIDLGNGRVLNIDQKLADMSDIIPGGREEFIKQEIEIALKEFR